MHQAAYGFSNREAGPTKANMQDLDEKMCQGKLQSIITSFRHDPRPSFSPSLMKRPPPITNNCISVPAWMYKPKQQLQQPIPNQHWNFVTNNPPLPPIPIPSHDDDPHDDTHELVHGVCVQCRQALIRAFDHCLARRTAALSNNESAKDIREGIMESVSIIDEVEDSKTVHPPPYFQVVPDPTLASHDNATRQIWDGPASKVARERYAWLESRKDATREDPDNIYIGNGSMPVFSGLLYKRQLAAKDHEIRNLREKLYDREKSECKEKENSEKLRVALGKSMRYYVYAEEWQEREGERLKRDVVALKGEVGSLMAFLVSAEEEKRKLLQHIESLNSTIIQRDEIIKEVETARDGFKVRLHASFKETLAMNGQMVKLQEMVDRGSEVVAKRNELLQQGLERMSADHEKLQNECIEYKTRIRDLEFELAEMQRQFDRMGNNRDAAEKEAMHANEVCAQQSADIGRLNSALEQSTTLREKLAVDLKNMTELQNSAKSSLTSQVQNLSIQLESVTKARNHLDTEATQLRSECKRLQSSLETVTNQKERLDAKTREEIAKLHADVSSRNSTIRELQFKSAEDSRIVRQVKEKNESLMSQCTDLMNGLEHETAEVKSLKFDIAKARRANDEAKLKLEDTVGLQKQRIDEQKATIQGLEDLKAQMQSELDTRAITIKELHDNYDRYKQESEKTMEELKRKLKASATAHTTLALQHKELLQSHHGLNNAEATLRSNHATVTAELLAKTSECGELRQQVTELQNSIEKLQQKCDAYAKEHENLKHHLDSTQAKCRELSTHVGQVEKEAASTIREKEAIIFNLTKDSQTARNEAKAAV
ncbi:hypothetical protein SeMB42_g06211, partial [Synchytrium endobioticum]